MALPIVAAGLPLLIEKPVCPSLAQTREVLDASRRAGTPLPVSYTPLAVYKRQLRDSPVRFPRMRGFVLSPHQKPSRPLPSA